MTTRKTKQSTELTLTQLKETLVSRKESIIEMLGANSDVDHYIAGIIDECDRNPAIRLCDPKSIMGCVRKSALYRMPLGQDLCYFVPYGRECTFQLGYRGLLSMARECGAITRHLVRSVHQGDLFHDGEGNPPDDGIRPRVKLEKHGKMRTWESMTHVYAHFILPNGMEHLEIMTKAEVEAHRDKYAKARGADTPWASAPLAMAKKTVIRRAFAGDQIPISQTVRQAVAADEFNEVIEGSVVPPQNASGGPDEAVIDQIEQTGYTEAGQTDELFKT